MSLIAPRAELRPLLGFMFVAVLALVFALLADGVMEGGLSGFDDRMFRLLRAPGAPPWLTEMARDITALGSFVVLGLILAVSSAGLFLAGARHAASLALAAVLGGTALSTALKMGFDRPRPQWPGAPPSKEFVIPPTSKSFPSGHAMLTAVTFLTLGALLARMTPHRGLKYFALTSAILITVLVGVTRVHLGVHYASDVLAGWCVGGAWALLCWLVALWLQRRGAVEATAPG